MQLKAAAVNKEVVLALVGVFQHRRPDLPSLKTSSSKGSHWTERIKDDRKIWKDPKVPDRGNPSGASSSSAPRVTLQPNVDSAAEFNDKRSDHRWVIVPALDDPLQLEIKIAKVARDLARSSNLNDSHGTMSFLEFMSQLET